jgi:hypothetical protein
MRADLERRIAALELKTTAPCPAWSIFIMPAGVDDELIVGFQHEECVIMREFGEPLESLQNRAKAAVTGSALVCIWRPLVANLDEQSFLDSP